MSNGARPTVQPRSPAPVKSVRRPSRRSGVLTPQILKSPAPALAPLPHPPPAARASHGLGHGQLAPGFAPPGSGPTLAQLQYAPGRGSGIPTGFTPSAMAIGRGNGSGVSRRLFVHELTDAQPIPGYPIGTRFVMGPNVRLRSAFIGADRLRAPSPYRRLRQSQAIATQSVRSSRTSSRTRTSSSRRRSSRTRRPRRKRRRARKRLHRRPPHRPRPRSRPSSPCT